MIIATECSFNYSESGKELNLEQDGKELSIAKKKIYRPLSESEPGYISERVAKMLNVALPAQRCLLTCGKLKFEFPFILVGIE